MSQTRFSLAFSCQTGYLWADSRGTGCPTAAPAGSGCEDAGCQCWQSQPWPAVTSQEQDNTALSFCILGVGTPA